MIYSSATCWERLTHCWASSDSPSFESLGTGSKQRARFKGVSFLVLFTPSGGSDGVCWFCIVWYTSCVYVPTSWNRVVQGGKTPGFFSSLTPSWFLTSDLKEISLPFFPHFFPYSMLSVGFCCVFLFKQASGSALVPLTVRCGSQLKPLSVGQIICGSLPTLLPQSLSACLGEETRGKQWCWATVSRSEWGSLPFTSLQFTASSIDHGGYPIVWLLKPWKGILGQSGKGFFLSSCHLIPTLNCFAFKGTNLTCWDDCSSFFLKDESASTEFSQPGLLLLCIGLKTLTSAVRLIYSTKGVKSVYSFLNSVLEE